MGDSVCIGVKTKTGIEAINLHYLNNKMVDDVLRLLAIHKMKGFKKVVKKYPEGFSGIFPLYKFLEDPEDLIEPYFSYGIDYGERGDDRSLIQDIRDKEYCYIAINDTTLRVYSGYGTSYKTYKITNQIYTETIKGILGD